MKEAGCHFVWLPMAFSWESLSREYQERPTLHRGSGGRRPGGKGSSSTDHWRTTLKQWLHPSEAHMSSVKWDKTAPTMHPSCSMELFYIIGSWRSPTRIAEIWVDIGREGAVTGSWDTKGILVRNTEISGSGVQGKGVKCPTSKFNPNMAPEVNGSICHQWVPEFMPPFMLPFMFSCLRERTPRDKTPLLKSQAEDREFREREKGPMTMEWAGWPLPVSRLHPEASRASMSEKSFLKSTGDFDSLKLNWTEPVL